MKKIVTVIAVVALLLNLICVQSYADDNSTPPISITPQETGVDEIMNDEGDTTNASITGTEYEGGQIFKTLALFLTSIPRAVNTCLNLFVEQTTKTNNTHFTIYDVVLGHYNIFNINFLEEVPENEAKIDTFMEEVKINVMKFYVVIRNMSIAISLFILVYTGIRMAISTVASEQAKYKNMLINWLSSLMILFLMHLIIIIISAILQIGLDIVEKIATSWGVSSIENTIFDNAVTNLSANGFNTFTSVVLIWVLTWYQVKFFIYYLRRTIEVHFLVVVAPLVTVTYSIDKSGDGKAQAFGNLIRELIIKCSMQLVHAILYIVFIGTAGVIAVSQPLIAIVFFMSLSRAEKIVRKLFEVNDEGFEKTAVPFTN